jgi:hypothetical protein
VFQIHYEFVPEEDGEVLRTKPAEGDAKTTSSAGAELRPQGLIRRLLRALGKRSWPEVRRRCCLDDAFRCEEEIYA